MEKYATIDLFMFIILLTVMEIWANSNSGKIPEKQVEHRC